VTKQNEPLFSPGVGLDVHGAEPVSHRFTICDADGNADVEFNFSFPLTHKRHAQLEHLLEEGYSQHDAYVLLAGGEILAHMEALKKAKR
jgi:hypothetical protein